MRSGFTLCIGLVFGLLSSSCFERSPSGGALSKQRAAPVQSLPAGQYWPDAAEQAVVGSIQQPVRRGSPEFGRLVAFDEPHIVFKDEEGTGADRLMALSVRERLNRLGSLVSREWPGIKVRVTEAWDENREHGRASVHYEGRALDLTTSDRDARRLNRLAGLATQAGFDWVFCESTHVHVSVRR
ncbi:MAG TPA: hypothetical protein VER33_14790 [Polyangiaceae bacterium]|nr:hypothetical protein [Polyangiaceae bacterium]